MCAVDRLENECAHICFWLIFSGPRSSLYGQVILSARSKKGKYTFWDMHAIVGESICMCMLEVVIQPVQLYLKSAYLSAKTNCGNLNESQQIFGNS